MMQMLRSEDGMGFYRVHFAVAVADGQVKHYAPSSREGGWTLKAYIKHGNKSHQGTYATRHGLSEEHYVSIVYGPPFDQDHSVRCTRDRVISLSQDTSCLTCQGSRS